MKLLINCICIGLLASRYEGLCFWIARSGAWTFMFLDIGDPWWGVLEIGIYGDALVNVLQKDYILEFESIDFGCSSKNIGTIVLYSDGVSKELFSPLILKGIPQGSHREIYKEIYRLLVISKEIPQVHMASEQTEFLIDPERNSLRLPYGNR